MIHQLTASIIYLHRRLGEAALLRELQGYSVGQSHQALNDLLRDRAGHLPASMEKQAALLGQRGVVVVTVLDSEYPTNLRELDCKAPPILYVQGDIARLNARSIAIIGMRKPCLLGKSMAGLAARAAVKDGWCVVSGNAPGVDAQAHGRAVEAGGETLIFPAMPLDSYAQCFRGDYPKQVTVASFLPPGVTTEAWMFLRRNSLVAAHCASGFVAETGTRGGTLDTVKKLLRLKREVFATEFDVGENHYEAHNMLRGSGVQLLKVSADESTEAFKPMLAAARNFLKRPMAKVPVLDDLFPQDGF